MQKLWDMIFDNCTLNAEVIYTGTVCGLAEPLCSYRAGTIHFVRSGRGRLELPSADSVPIVAPALVFFPSSSRHRVQAVDDAGVEMICAVAQFSETFSRTVAISFPAVAVLPLDNCPEVAHTLQSFFKETGSQEAGSQHFANRLCELLLCYLVRELSRAGQLRPGLLAAATDKRIAGALTAIHTRYQTPLDVDMLAQSAGMSRSRFVALFGQLVGTSPHQYLLSYRMDVARQLLRNGLSVKAVAQGVGYGTASAFVRKFKEVVGASPGTWSE